MRYVSRTEFKTAPKGASIRKDLLVEAPEPIADRQIKFTISSPTVDRSGDVINQAGWELASYLRNPVVLWGHDSSQLPIAKCVAIGLENGSLKATVEFVPETTPVSGPMAEACYLMCKQGFLNATSVGFKPLEWSETDDDARGAGTYSAGVDFARMELMEFSIVSIPDNPEALIEPNQKAPQPLIEPAKSVRDGVNARNRRKRAMELLGIR